MCNIEIIKNPKEMPKINTEIVSYLPSVTGNDRKNLFLQIIILCHSDDGNFYEFFAPHFYLLKERLALICNS